jgi:deoxyribonuclease IV
LSVHAPYFINLNANDEEWPKSRKRLMDAAHYGNLAGATDIIFHPGSYFERPPAEVLKMAIPRLKDVHEGTAQGEEPGDILRPETMGKSAMLGSVEDTLKMSKAIKGVQAVPRFCAPARASRRWDDELGQGVESAARSVSGRRWGRRR